MPNEDINEKRVDAAFETVERLRSSAWNLTIAEAAALSERVRVEIMLDKTMSGAQKRWYRAYSDYLDDIVDERMEKAGIDRASFHNWVLRYIRGFLNDD